MTVIRQRLRLKTLSSCLKLYAKKKRVTRGYLRPANELQALAKNSESVVEKIQGMIRVHQARKTCNFHRNLLELRRVQKWRREVKLRSILINKTRDKETYFVQRVTLGRIETDAINKYVTQAEAKFEANWTSYEQQLEKYLTASTKTYKDWIQKKDETGFVLWQNLNTLEQQREHPGVKVFKVNKKVLKAKAQQELATQFANITDRKYIINEAIISLRQKVTTDLSTIRMTNRYSTHALKRRKI